MGVRGNVPTVVLQTRRRKRETVTVLSQNPWAPRESRGVFHLATPASIVALTRRVKFLPLLAPLLALLRAVPASGARAPDDFFDRMDEALTVSAFHDQVRARLSGTLDLEGYQFDFPAPGLVFTKYDALFNPRLTLFLDAQIGPRIYVFAQARADRGFDPSDRAAEVRLDEYALRVTPWEDGRWHFQIGKFATIVGNWAARHGSWENPFITAPLPYENLTGIWDSAAARTSATLFSWAHVRDGLGGFFGDERADKILRLPIIWGPAYTSGLAAFGQIGKFDYAVDCKNAALASRPESWDGTQVQWQHPTVSARVGFRPNAMFRLGFSASGGSYLHPDAAPTVAPGHSLADYREIVFGQDFAFAWHRWQVWAELYEARFEIPNVGNADTFAYYVEARYKITPQLCGALRWNQQLFSSVRNGEGGRTQWGREIWRLDTALGYRLNAHTQLKLQYSFQHEDDAPRAFGHTLAAQFTVRF